MFVVVQMKRGLQNYFSRMKSVLANHARDIIPYLPIRHIDPAWQGRFRQAYKTYMPLTSSGYYVIKPFSPRKRYVSPLG